MANGKPIIIAQIELALPGYRAVSAQIAVEEGDIVELDDVAIQLHTLLNEAVQEVRKVGKLS